MPITLGQNISSLNARRYLDGSTALFSAASGRLSSGQRISTPSDDPAGLAVTAALSTKSRVLGRAGRNLSDGISALQTAEGGLTSIQTLLVRMNELAEQAANGSLSSVQRKSLDEEFQSLSKEIQRVSRTTSFNRISLLSGQRSARAPSAMTATGLLGPAGLSGDGRYAVTATAADGVRLHDLQTGAITTVDAAASNANTVMASNGDIVYSKGGQLFHFSRSSGTISQITASLDADPFLGLAISADGTTVAFTTTTRYTNEGKVSDGGVSSGMNITLLNLDTGVLKVLDGNSYLGSDGFRLSNDGSKLLFYQDAGLWQDIYYVDETILTPRNIATHNVPGFIPIIGGVTDDGRAFYGAFDDFVQFTGNLELIEYNGNTQTNSLVHAISYSGPDIYSIASITVGADNNTLQILSGHNYTGENTSEHIQAFKFDLSSRQFTQLTSFTGELSVSASPTSLLSGDGSRLVYLGAGSRAFAVDLSPESSPLDIEAGFGSAGRLLASLPGLEGGIRGIWGIRREIAAGSMGCA